MPISHVFLAILVTAIWGCNFIFIEFGIKEISPLLLCAIRFFLASFPAILFIKPPSREQLNAVILYGLIAFGLQFSLLFLGMHAGMSPGLASLLMQVQIFFSIFFAVILLGEAPNVFQVLGGLVSFSGISLVALHFDKSTSILGFILIICAAAAWGAGNLIPKKAPKMSMITLIVWGSFFACFPLFVTSLFIEGTSSIAQSYHQLSWLGIISLVYIVYLSTWVGYGLWSWLITQHAVATIAPFTLLVPIFAMLSSVLFTGELFQLWKFYAGILVISGLCINLLGTRLLSYLKYKK
jgi:O-acetylserine/cysteine efflux transporter